MSQKVLKVGSSAAVTISKHALDDLGLKVGDYVHVVANKKRREVSIRPVKDVGKDAARIAHLTYAFIQRYRQDLDSLAKK